jgi:hypothetical protein
MRSYCFRGSGDDVTFTPSYPFGATDFVILSNTFPSSSVDNTTGEVDLDIDLVNPGVYYITIKYTIGETDYYFSEQIIITSCDVELLQDEVTICVTEIGARTFFQLSFVGGETYDDFELVSSTLSGDIGSFPTGYIGLKAEISEVGMQEVVFSVDGGGIQFTLTVNVVDCPTPAKSNINECQKDVIGIVWVNQEGGRQSYWFGQVKDFKINQQDGKTYENSSKELRYFDKGRVSNGVNIFQEFIPLEHVTSIASLKNSIQAWACTNIDEFSTYKAIIIDEDSWVLRRTNDRFYSAAFQFEYAKEITIQRQ